MLYSIHVVRFVGVDVAKGAASQMHLDPELHRLLVAAQCSAVSLVSGACSSTRGPSTITTGIYLVRSFRYSRCSYAIEVIHQLGGAAEHRW